MPRTVRHNPRTPPSLTLEERTARRELTIERLRALSGEQAKQLLERLINRNEVTGICVHSQAFVDAIALGQEPPSENDFVWH